MVVGILVFLALLLLFRRYVALQVGSTAPQARP